MEKKQLWMIIAGLIMLNCLTVAFFLTRSEWSKSFATENGENHETVAMVGKDTISRQEWLAELENNHGESVLKDLINQKVVEQMAKEYNISVSDKEVDRELSMYKTMYGSITSQDGNESNWRKQIKHSLLLEELLIKDVEVPQKEIEKFYNDNKALFNVPESYHVSQIILKTKEEADQTFQELEQGSNFSVLAMEKSIDDFTANRGGDIGYINENNDRFSSDLLEHLKEMKTGEWSQPIKIEEGYAIVLLHDKLKGTEYSFEEVENQIRRQIALEQMEAPVSAITFWNEVGVDWFYGQKE